MAWFFLLLPVVFMIFMLILGSFFMAYIVSSQGTALKKMKDAKQHKEGAQMEGMEMEGMLPKEGVRRMLPKEGVGPMQIEGMHHKMEGMHHKMDGYHPFWNIWYNLQAVNMNLVIFLNMFFKHLF